MSKNTSYIYEGIVGLFCECGNAEVITDDNPTYRRFTRWWDTSGGRGSSKVSCLKCHSDVHSPDVRPQPTDIRERLQTAYPGTIVDEMLAKSAMAQ